ncbi:MAG TPA: 50S ribosomal protein L6 [bacterium]|nr:50S ribosomal protein L6 [bacterium]HOL49389.1 50S ribosomal protein L6 [bacterium]HPO51410.1 50S ribosomal protein L6 [bacterium]HXK45712.1 50S ribosomal protein L6 [bacterium]
MGRLGKKPVEIPDGVKITMEGRVLSIEGPKGRITQNVFENLDVTVEDKKIFVVNTVPQTTKFRRLFKKTDALQGLLRTLIKNRILGVTKGFEKTLEIHGTGFKAEVKGKKLMLNLGFTHPVEVDIPEPITVQIEKNTVMKISSYDKDLLGNFAADIRDIYPPEPYKGKEIRYAGEYVRHKVGKAAVGTQK